jgi:hypothetical protein
LLVQKDERLASISDTRFPHEEPLSFEPVNQARQAAPAEDEGVRDLAHPVSLFG